MISFITFTRNSAKYLPSLLENVSDVVDEIVIIDGYSTDNTLEIAKMYNAKVYQRKPWGMWNLIGCMHYLKLHMNGFST